VQLEQLEYLGNKGDTDLAGSDGANGIDELPWDCGVAGATGIQGNKGDTGLAGSDGANGTDGLWSNWNTRK
jgi:hypothetical protein